VGLTLEELAVILARLDTKVDALVERFDNNTLVCTKCIEDHEERLRGLEFREPGNPAVAKQVKDLEERVRLLENWQWKVIGIAIGASVSITWLVGTII
jgi:hypothetical protein